jgi:hypothetical protein
MALVLAHSRLDEATRPFWRLLLERVVQGGVGVFAQCGAETTLASRNHTGLLYARGRL